MNHEIFPAFPRKFPNYWRTATRFRFCPIDGKFLTVNVNHGKNAFQSQWKFLSLQLRREQELQQQKLWRDFQEQKKELELQHKMQIESKLQVSFVLF